MRVNGGRCLLFDYLTPLCPFIMMYVELSRTVKRMHYGHHYWG